MLVGRVQRCIQSEVYSNTAAHDSFAIEVLANVDCRFDVEEGSHDAAKRFQRCPGMNGRILIYGFAYLDEV